MSPHALFHTISVPGEWISGFSFTFRGCGERMVIKKDKIRLRLFMPNRHSENCSLYMPNNTFIFSDCRKTESVPHTVRSMETGFDLHAMEAVIQICLFPVFHYNSTKNDKDFCYWHITYLIQQTLKKCNKANLFLQITTNTFFSVKLIHSYALISVNNIWGKKRKGKYNWLNQKAQFPWNQSDF